MCNLLEFLRSHDRLDMLRDFELEDVIGKEDELTGLSFR